MPLSFSHPKHVQTHVHIHTHAHTYMNNLRRPRCYARSPTAKDTFQLIPSVVSCDGVTRKWGLLSYAQNACQKALPYFGTKCMHTCQSALPYFGHMRKAAECPFFSTIPSLIGRVKTVGGITESCRVGAFFS